MSRGVLVMAYGTPRGLDEVEAYYTDIRRGRPPTPERLAELIQRYRAIGGSSPLLEITSAQARGIQERTGMHTYVGMKHAAPTIPEAIAAMTADGIERALGLVLAPHYSEMSIGDYEKRARGAASDVGWPGELEMIDSWHLEPGYIALLSTRVEEAIASIDGRADDTVIVFTAHSLPEAILKSGDPYARQLLETAAAVAERAGLARWQIGWQSAGGTDAAWLGPDILEILQKLAAEGALKVVVCPCGFVSDHLEVLYDLDIEATALAGEIGIDFARTASPNDDPAFLDALANVVTVAMGRL